eukprot:Opistho-1_new@27242
MLVVHRHSVRRRGVVRVTVTHGYRRPIVDSSVRVHARRRRVGCAVGIVSGIRHVRVRGVWVLAPSLGSARLWRIRCPVGSRVFDSWWPGFSSTTRGDAMGSRLHSCLSPCRAAARLRTPNVQEELRIVPVEVRVLKHDRALFLGRVLEAVDFVKAVHVELADEARKVVCLERLGQNHELKLCRVANNNARPILAPANRLVVLLRIEKCPQLQYEPRSRLEFQLPAQHARNNVRVGRGLRHDRHSWRRVTMARVRRIRRDISRRPRRRWRNAVRRGPLPVSGASRRGRGSLVHFANVRHHHDFRQYRCARAPARGNALSRRADPKSVAAYWPAKDCPICPMYSALI